MNGIKKIFLVLFAGTLWGNSGLYGQTIKLEKVGRVYKTECKVNGLKLSMYLDTGADEVTISAVEALFMIKNGYLAEEDILESQYHTIANGDIVEGTEIILRKVEIAGHVLTNVHASIVHSVEAPLLMGQSALSKLGKITIDYENNTLTINGKNDKASQPVSAGKDVKKTAGKPASVNKVKGNLPKDMVLVEGGTFSMGNSYGKDDEKPVHTVSVSSFYMCKYEVAVGQFRQFIKATGYRTKAEADNWVTVWDGKAWVERHNIWWEHDAAGNKRTPVEDNEPVLYLTWDDAVKYCEWMSTVTNLHYRLPTEAEWEYAAKGGKLTHNNIYSGNNTIDVVGWYAQNGGSQTHPVGKKQANELGIYDMTGNVIEYTSDWYAPGYYGVSAAENPKGAAGGKAKVARGGGWHSKAPDSRNTDRHYDETWSRCNYNGFRVVMNE